MSLFNRSKETRYIYRHEADGFRYFKLYDPERDLLEQESELLTRIENVKYKLHLNLALNSFSGNEEIIIKAINLAANEAKLGDVVLVFKHVLYSQDDALDRLKAEFLKKILDHPGDVGLLTDVKKFFGIERFQDCYAVFQDEIENIIGIEKSDDKSGGKVEQKTIPHASSIKKVDELILWAKRKYADFLYEVVHANRFIGKSQFVLYLFGEDFPAMADKVSLFIKLLEAKLSALGLACSADINKTDAPLTQYVSFRQENLEVKAEDSEIKTVAVARFEKDEEYNLVFQPANLQKLKDQQKNCELYKLLVQKCKEREIYAVKPEAKTTAGSYVKEFLALEMADERRFNVRRKKNHR